MKHPLKINNNWSISPNRTKPHFSSTFANLLPIQDLGFSAAKWCPPILGKYECPQSNCRVLTQKLDLGHANKLQRSQLRSQKDPSPEISFKPNLYSNSSDTQPKIISINKSNHKQKLKQLSERMSSGTVIMVVLKTHHIPLHLPRELVKTLLHHDCSRWFMIRHRSTLSLQLRNPSPNPNHHICLQHRKLNPPLNNKTEEWHIQWDGLVAHALLSNCAWMNNCTYIPWNEECQRRPSK